MVPLDLVVIKKYLFSTYQYNIVLIHRINVSRPEVALK